MKKKNEKNKTPPNLLITIKQTDEEEIENIKELLTEQGIYNVRLVKSNKLEENEE